MRYGSFSLASINIMHFGGEKSWLFFIKYAVKKATFISKQWECNESLHCNSLGLFLLLIAILPKGQVPFACPHKSS